MITRLEFMTKAVNLEEACTTDYSEESTSNGSGCVYIGSDKEDHVVNYSNGAKIYTGAGNDSVTSIACGVVIDTQDGNDSIIAVGAGTQVSAGAGNDRIFVQDITPGTKISIGTGSDVVYMAGYANENTLEKSEDDVADLYLTPAFTFQYVKGKGLIIDPNSCKDEKDKEDNNNNNNNNSGGGCCCCHK